MPAVPSLESMGVARPYESSLGRSWTTSLFPDRERSLKRVWFSVEESAVGEAGRGTVLDRTCKGLESLQNGN